MTELVNSPSRGLNNVARSTFVILCLTICTWIASLKPFQLSYNLWEPFKMSFNQLAVCDEPVGVFVFPTKVSKKSRTTVAYSCKPCIIGVTLDDSISLIVKFANYGNGGWRPNFLTLYYKKFCSEGWPIIGKSAINMLSMNHTKAISCPLKSGNYFVDNYEVDLSKYEKVFPVLPYGKFRADVEFWKKSERSACVRLYVDVVPKGQKKG